MRDYNIAILECDTPMQPVVDKFGTYGDIFKKFLEDGLAQFVQESGNDGVKATITASNMVEEGALPNLEETDCILLTGSRHTAMDNSPWILRLVEFMHKASEASHVRLVGICFGHQIIARALGGVLGTNPKGWEVSVDRIQLTDVGKTVLQLDSLRINQMHRDVVLELPEGVDNMGQSPVCDIQGMYVANKLFCLQAHPEFNDFIMSTILQARYKQGIFDEKTYQSGMERIGSHDGSCVAVAIWRFLLAES